MWLYHFLGSLLTCGHGHQGEQLFLELSETTKTSVSSCRRKACGRSAEKGSRRWHQSLVRQVCGHQQVPQRVSAHFPFLPGQGLPGPRRACARHTSCHPTWETSVLRWNSGCWGHTEPSGPRVFEDPTLGRGFAYLFIWLHQLLASVLGTFDLHAACGVCSCDIQAPSGRQPVGSSSFTRD